RHVWRELQGTAIPAQLLEAGAQVVVDTCTYYGNLVRDVEGQVLTNSAKWAYYGPGTLGLPVQFASMNSCVEAAINGRWQHSELFLND
ncbi:MAG: aconitase X, partial [Pseudomonadota bacterium]